MPPIARRRPPTAAADGAADSLDRLAVLLEAGVAPATAWRHLAAASPGGPAARVADALARGEPGGAALAAAAGPVGEKGPDPALAWRQAAAAWQVAEESGAPLASSLGAITEALRAVEQAQRDAAVALAGPVATTRIVLALPGVGLALGALLGVDSVGVLALRPVGWILLAAAGALVAAARAWSRRLVERAQPSGAVPGLELELLAVGLQGGVSWEGARERVRRALAEHCPGPAPGAPESAGSRIDEIRRLSESAGVPASALLRAAAERERRQARATSAMASERLAVMLMLPLGACILPAFLLVAVVPMVIALLSSTGLAG